MKVTRETQAIFLDYIKGGASIGQAASLCGLCHTTGTTLWSLATNGISGHVWRGLRPWIRDGAHASLEEDGIYISNGERRMKLSEDQKNLLFILGCLSHREWVKTKSGKSYQAILTFAENHRRKIRANTQTRIATIESAIEATSGD